MQNGHVWISLAVVLALLELWAIMRILRSGTRADRRMLWVLFIVFVPVLGLLAWWLAGPKVVAADAATNRR